jgi:hypothetical protein
LGVILIQRRAVDKAISLGDAEATLLKNNQGEYMKYILFAALSCFSMAAHANGCADNVSEADKFKNLSAQVDVFGTWKGTYNGEALVVKLTKNSSGHFIGELNLGDDQIGPTGVQICDYGTQFSLVVYWQEAELEVISSKKVQITLPFDGNPKVIVTKQK